MTKSVATVQPDAQAPQVWSGEEIQLLKDQAFKDLTPAEFSVACYVASTLRLNPLLKQVHAVVRNSGGKRTMVMQTGIDGFRLTAQRTGDYAGSDEAIVEMERESPNRATALPIKASVTVWRMVQGQRCPFTATANWKEYAPDLSSPAGFFWKKMPVGQLVKCAEALALRKAFPAELSGLYSDDEMHQADHRPPAAQPSQGGKAEQLNRRIQPTKGEPRDVHAEVTDPSKGVQDPSPAASSDYTFDFSKKYLGTKLTDHSVETLLGFRAYLEESALKTGKAMGDKAERFINALEDYLDELEGKDLP